MSSQPSTAAPHPLDPLAPEEISRATRILRESGRITERARFSQLALREPTKAELAGFEAGGAAPREARAVLFDREGAGSCVALMSLSEEKLVSFEPVSAGQASLSFLDMLRAIQLVKAHPEWQAAMRRRGLEDLDAVQVDPWVTGDFPPDGPEGAGRRGHRILRALSYRRDFKRDNGYARPVEGVIGFVDLTTDEVIRIEDHGVVPFPPEPGNYDPQSVGPLRRDLRPLEISQPEGPSFEIEGSLVRWQRWSFRVSLEPIHGLTLRSIRYRDGGRERRILRRAGLAEMVVPYADPSPMHYWKSVFDAGEMGLGHLTNSLELGCDCLGEIRYLDAHLVRPDGEPMTIRRAICLHEEDYGILWKHTDLLGGSREVRRSRRMVVSAIHTIGNYEYGFYWYFYLDGTMQLEVKLTGVMQTSALRPGEEPVCAPLVAPQLAAPNHQHLFNVRLDFELDGERNSVYEVDLERLPDDQNPHGNAFAARARLLARESEAVRDADPTRGRTWVVANPAVRNRVGRPVSYKLVPGSAPRLLARPDSSVARRAAFATHDLWVTAYDPAELAAGGDHPNQHPGGAGLPAYVAADRPLENADVVLWHSFGVSHVPRPEDWPVMPVEYTGFTLQPLGFFDRNPSLDVPPPGGCPGGNAGASG